MTLVFFSIPVEQRCYFVRREHTLFLEGVTNTGLGALGAMGVKVIRVGIGVVYVGYA